MSAADDGNSYWRVRGRTAAVCERGQPVRCGQAIRLTHLGTGRNLHSHNFVSPLSGNQVPPRPCEQPSCAIPQMGTSCIQGLQARPVLWSLPDLPGHTETLLGALVPAGSLLLLSGPYWLSTVPARPILGHPGSVVSHLLPSALSSPYQPHLVPQPTPICHLKTSDLQGSPRPKQVPVSPILSPSCFSQSSFPSYPCLGL